MSETQEPYEAGQEVGRGNLPPLLRDYPRDLLPGDANPVQDQSGWVTSRWLNALMDTIAELHERIAALEGASFWWW